MTLIRHASMNDLKYIHVETKKKSDRLVNLYRQSILQLELPI